MVLEVRGGNSAFCRNGINYTEDSNGCFRKILLRSLGYEVQPVSDFDKLRQKLTFALGHANESVMVQTIEEYTKNPVQVECEVISSITDAVRFYGHADVVDYTGKVYELKSVSSIKTYYGVFVDCKYKLNNLAQLVAYMIGLKAEFGELRYTNFIYISGVKDMHTDYEYSRVSPYFKAYQVQLKDDDIIIDGEVSEWKVSDVIEHQNRAAEILISQDIIRERPNNKTAGCGYCELRSLCANKQLDNDLWLQVAKGQCVKTNKEEV